jgi:hypothetical protein
MTYREAGIMATKSHAACDFLREAESAGQASAWPTLRASAMRSKGDKPVCEVTLVPPRDGEPARLIVTDLYSGHSDGWELSPGVRLVVVKGEEDPAREFIREVAENVIVAEDFTEGNECFNEVVQAAREACGELGIEFEPGELPEDESIS